MIKYMRGVVLAHFGYSDVTIPFRLLKNKSHLFSTEMDATLPEVRVNEKKVQDVKELMPFIDLKRRVWFEKNVFF